MRGLARGLVLSLVLVASAVARADDTQAAAEHFREGRRAFAAHDYAHAAVEFEAANKAKPASAALLGAGLAWEFAGDLLHAALDLSAALDFGGLEPRDEATARKHFADIERKVGYVEVTGPAGARLSIDGHDEGVLPLRVRVLPGEHSLEARAEGGAPLAQTATVAAGGTVRVHFVPAPATAPPHPAQAPPLQRTLGWIGVGSGAALFVAGAIIGGVGLGARDAFVNGGDTDASLRDQAIALRTGANVLWATAGVFAIAGVVLVLTAPRARVSVGLNGVAARVEF